MQRQGSTQTSSFEIPIQQANKDSHSVNMRSNYGPPPSDDSDDSDGFDWGEDRTRRSVRVAPVKSRIEQERDDLYVAIRDGNLRAFKEQLKEVKWFRVNEPVTPNNWTPLQLASSSLHVDIVEYLLVERCAKATVFNEGRTALHCVCAVDNTSEDIEPRVFKIVKLLVNARADINRPALCNETAFMLAIRNGYETVVDFLLSTKMVALEIADSSQNTSIFYAVEYNRPNVVRKLIDLGVFVDVTNHDGFTPHELAVAKGFTEIEAIIPYVEIRMVPSSYRSISCYKDFIPMAYPDRGTPAYIQDIFPLLYGMRVVNVEFKIVDANIDLVEFLNISDERLKQIGVDLPFQRRRILHGLLKFHQHKFNKSLMVLPSLEQSPDICDYFNVIAKCLKYMVMMRCALKFIHRKDLFGHTQWVSTNKTNDHIDDLNEFLAEIRQLLKRLIAGVEKRHRLLSPPPPLLITGKSVSSIQRRHFLLRSTTIGAVTLASLVIAMKLWRK